MKERLQISAWLIMVSAVIQCLGYFIALPNHLDESSWSAHAQFHLVLSFIWIAGFDITLIVLAWGPLQKRERWAFWSLAAAFIFAQGGHFLASALVPAGRPPEPWYDWAIGGYALIYAVGLIIGWRALNTPSEALS